MKTLNVLLVFAILGSLLMGCGSRKVDRKKAQAATISDDVGGLTDTNPNKPLLECIVVNPGFITAKMSTYYDQNYQLRTEAIRMQIADIDYDFDSNRGHYLQFFRWKASATRTDLDETPVTIRFEHRNSPNQVFTGNYTHINHTDMIEIANEKSLAGTTTQAVLQSLTLVLSGLSFEDDAVKIVIYDENGNSVYQTDALLPGIHVNPSHYADDHGNPRADVLMQLHPYYSTLSENRDDSFFSNIAQQSRYCFNGL